MNKRILENWERDLVGFELEDGTLLRKIGALAQAIGIQKNRFDSTYRVNVMILLQNPLTTQYEVIIFAHLCKRSVCFGAPPESWWDPRGSSLRCCSPLFRRHSMAR
jgi:hypothetical protein